MSYQGHCLCRGIQVSLEEQPANSLRCYCRNCGRSGGASSLNYVIDSKDFDISDAKGFLKSYVDTETFSGNHVTRQICGNCGSPVSTESPAFLGKALIKASLFDTISKPSAEVFIERRPEWAAPTEGAEQVKGFSG